MVRLSAEPGDQRVQRGGGQWRRAAHADPHVHADGQPDRHGYTNRDRYCDAYPHRNGYLDGGGPTATPTASATPARLWLPLILR